MRISYNARKYAHDWTSYIFDQIDPFQLVPDSPSSLYPLYFIFFFQFLWACFSWIYALPWRMADIQGLTPSKNKQKTNLLFLNNNEKQKLIS